MNNKNRYFFIIFKTVIALIFFGLSIVYWKDLGGARSANILNDMFLILIGVAILIILLPIEKIYHIKAGPLELFLERPQIKETFSRFPDSIPTGKLKHYLSRNRETIEAIRGSRILWIDDNPHYLLGERRLLRDLGIIVVSAISSEMARQIIDADNDFDLIITDVQRKGESYKDTNGIMVHEGVNFIVKNLLSIDDDFIRSVPIIFYAAYDWDRLVKFTAPARVQHAQIDICNDFVTFITKVITRLQENRIKPWTYKIAASKNPTSLD